MPELTVDQLTLALAIVAGVALLTFLFALVLGAEDQEATSRLCDPARRRRRTRRLRRGLALP